MDEQKQNRLAFWIHLLVVIAVWSSPFWLSWKLIIVGVAIYYLQLLILGNCVLTRWQFQSREIEISFYAHVLEKFGLRFNHRTVSAITDYVIPWIVLLIALIWQTHLVVYLALGLKHQ